MIGCSADLGTVKVRFRVTAAASGALAADFIALLGKYATDIHYDPSVTPDKPQRPPRRRNRPKSPQTQMREQLEDLKHRGQMPPDIDAAITWGRNPETGQPALGRRGRIGDAATDAYWELVDRGIIKTTLTRPKRYVKSGDA